MGEHNLYIYILLLSGLPSTIAQQEVSPVDVAVRKA